MKRLLLLGILAAFLLPALPASATDGPQVVVVGVPGLRWSDVNERDTPTLVRLQREGASGALSVKTAAPIDCPADGWLTLGAGNRVVAAGRHGSVCAAGFPSPGSLPEQVRRNADRREGAQPGLLADELKRTGRCVAGGGPGAALGAAASDGSEAAGSDRITVDGDANAAVTASGCQVVFVQATAVGSGARASGARAADASVARVDDLRPAGSTLIVVGLSEAPGDDEPHLHVALAVGPDFRAGALTSASTRRTPYVQVMDVAPTILAAFGREPPDAMAGEPWRSTGSVPTLAELRDEDVKAVADRRTTVPFFVVFLALELVLLVVAIWRRWWRTTELVALAATCAVGASYLANLVPWWRTGAQLAALLGLTFMIAAVMTAITLLGRGLLARAGLACGLVALILVGDLLTGAHLQLSSVAGYSPLVAGRFAGLGNVAFGVFAASVLLAAASTRSATVAALCGLAVIVDGAPQWGSDVGGVLALVPAFTLLVLLLGGRTASFGRLAIAGLVGAAVVAAFGIADHARPADQQTHLGRFVGQVLDGTAGGVLQRKAESNVSLLFHSVVTALLPLVVAAVVVVFLRPPPPLRRVFERSPAWRAGLLAVATAGGLGFIVNDSGAAVAALAIVVAVPATVAVLARHARLADPPG
jgi:hypothetical protein